MTLCGTYFCVGRSNNVCIVVAENEHERGVQNS